MLSESSYPRHPGGAGKCSHQLAAGLVAKGHRVHLVSETADDPCRETIDGVEVYRLPRLEGSALAPPVVEAATSEHVLQYLEEKVPLASIDVVHDSGGFLSYFFPVALALKERWSLPFVLHFRYLMIRHRILETDTGELDLLGRGFLGFESFLHIRSQGFPVRFADRVVVLSQDDADFVREQYRPSARLEVLPDPVAFHEVSEHARAETRRRLGGGDGAPLILFGGRIGDTRFKGTDIVFQAFHRLKAAQPRSRLVLAANDASVIATFRRAFGDAVVTPGWIDDAQALAEHLAAVDVVWIPSRYEPFGLMCAESMAVGTPVIASPVGGLREMIEHGRSGLLLSRVRPDRWVEELADRTAELIRRPERRAAMGTRARTFAREQLALDAVAGRMEQVYREITSAGSQRDATALTRPGWDDADTEAYLDRLAALAGDDARTHGEAVLADWDATAADRCRGCSHAHMADTIQALERFGRTRMPRALLGGAGQERLARAVAAVCPLALRQKELASNRPYGAPIDRGLRAST